MMPLDSRFCDGYLTVGRRGAYGKKAGKQGHVKSVNRVANIFHTAVEDSDITHVKLLLKYGNINLEELNKNGRTVLQEACLHDDMEILRLLVDYGACLETRDTFGWTVLHYASFFGNIEAVRLLILNCADVEAINNSGETPIDLASARDVRDFLVNCIKPVRRGQSLESDSDTDSDFVDESQSTDSSHSNHDSIFDSGFDFDQSKESEEEEELFEEDSLLEKKFKISLSVSGTGKTKCVKKPDDCRRSYQERKQGELTRGKGLKKFQRTDTVQMSNKEHSSITLATLQEEESYLEHDKYNVSFNSSMLSQRDPESLAQASLDSVEDHQSTAQLNVMIKPARNCAVSKPKVRHRSVAQQRDPSDTRCKIQKYRSVRKRMRMLSLRKVCSENDISQLNDDLTFRTPKIKKVSNTDKLNLIGE